MLDGDGSSDSVPWLHEFGYGSELSRWVSDAFDSVEFLPEVIIGGEGSRPRKRKRNESPTSTYISSDYSDGAIAFYAF